MASNSAPVIDLSAVADGSPQRAAAGMNNNNNMVVVVSLLDDDDDSVAAAAMKMPSPRPMAAAVAGNKRRRTIIDNRKAPPISAAQAAAIDNRKEPPIAAAAADASDVQFVSTTRSPLHQILEVFPDVKIDHARTLLTQNGANVPQVLAILAAAASYPKEEQEEKKGFALVHKEKDKSEFRHDYYSSSSFVSSSYSYRTEAVEQLLLDFPFLSKTGAKKLLAVAQHHYAVCHKSIKEAILGGDPTSSTAKDEIQQEMQYRTWKSAVSSVPLTATQNNNLLKLVPGNNYRGRLTVVRPRRSSDVGLSYCSSITDATLQEEIRFVQTKMAEWEKRMKTLLERKRAREKSKRDGTLLECACCYDSVAFEEMIPCRDEGHLFCVDCVRRFAESQIFGASGFGINPKTKKPALELLCMSSDGCVSGIDRCYLKTALSDKVLEKYDELAFHASVNAAGIGGELCACPKCGYEAALPDTQQVFQCPVAECLFESCRKCGEASHIPMRCDEVERDKVETKGRLKVEEAITQAKIRTCPTPKCQTKFVKSDGCNKMTCTKCGQNSCYICRKPIPKSIGYKHFCQKFECNHVNCEGCPLYTNTEQDDKRAMREAGIQAAEAVREESLQAEEEADGKPHAVQEVRVDVDRLLN